MQKMRGNVFNECQCFKLIILQPNRKELNVEFFFVSFIFVLSSSKLIFSYEI
jgi:hypothetical protein